MPFVCQLKVLANVLNCQASINILLNLVLKKVNQLPNSAPVHCAFTLTCASRQKQRIAKPWLSLILVANTLGDDSKGGDQVILYPDVSLNLLTAVSPLQTHCLQR